MVTQQPLNPSIEVIYPDSDGKPMADNTEQFRWIVVIEQNLEWLFADNANVFVAGDLLWYPVQGNNRISAAPDTMVVFGRPKGYRGSYQQWKEDNIAPQVAFEILSPNNSAREMEEKLLFYSTYGVAEYYLYDPERKQVRGWVRGDKGYLDCLETMAGWVSPCLGIRFELEEELALYRPDGVPFYSFAQINEKLAQEHQRAEQEAQRANQEAQRAEQEAQRANQEAQRADRLAAKLREMGIEPDTV